MADAHKNFAYSTVLTAPSPATSGTTLSVQIGDEAKFPAVPFNATVWPIGTQLPVITNAEVVRVTAMAGNQFTITRLAETYQATPTARSIVVGDQIAATISTKTFTDIEADLANADAQIALQGSQIEVSRIADLGYFVCSGGAITVNGATAGGTACRLDMAASVDFMATTELVMAAKTAQTALATANSTTVASGSNTIHTNTFTGSSSLSVASTTGFPSAGTLMVTHSGVVSVITYTGTTGGLTFIGCRLVNGIDIAMATSDTVVGSNADITYPLWAAIELDASGVWNVNLGSAAATPSFPTINVARVPHAFLYIPANATSIDTLLTTNNGNAKLINASSSVATSVNGSVRSVHPARRFASDHSSTSVNNTQMASLITVLGTPISIPANSISAGDIFKLSASGRFTPGATADTTLELEVIIGSLTLDATTPSLTKAGNTSDFRNVWLAVEFEWSSGGSLAIARAGGLLTVSAVGTTNAISMGGSTGSAGGAVIEMTATSGFIDNTAAITIDLQAARGLTATNCTFTLRHFSITKYPA